MHVGIDISSIIYGRGVSRYTSNLVRSLQNQPYLELSLYGASFRQKPQLVAAAQALISKKPGSALRTHVKIQQIPPTAQDWLWNTFQVNQVQNSLPGIEVFHSWDWLQPPDKNLPLVSTIHDLAILKYPQTAHPQVLKLHQKSWKKLKTQHAHIIAVSRATKKDIVELLEYPPALVHVVHEALPTEVVSVSEQLSEEKYDYLKNKLQLSQPFILFVGTREPRKNLLKLIQAWQPLAADFQLIIAGESGWDETTNLKSRNLRFLGRVSDQELSVLYSEAEVFAYPCLYEGFGLPILEAFHYGTPVVTSNRSSMIEVAGNAAELVDPDSVESIRHGIQSVLNESLTEQQKRLQRMIIRLQMFDWDQVAKQTIAVYQSAIEDAS